MGDILDTMNELAEKKEDPSDHWNVIADMAPPPQGWDKPKRTPPPPPEPPPGRLMCSSCGYTAPEPEFNEKHPYCKVGRAMWAVFGGVVIAFVYAIVMVILHGLGLINT